MRCETRNTTRKNTRAFVRLERVIGNTSKSNASFSVHRSTGHIAFAAGGVTAIYDPKKNKQLKLLRDLGSEGRTVRHVNSIDYSKDGKWIAIGEGGHNPNVLIWPAAADEDEEEASSNTSSTAKRDKSKTDAVVAKDTEAPVALVGHKVEVRCVRFSPSSELLVTADKTRLCVWKRGVHTTELVSDERTEAEVNAIAFDETGRYFILACSCGVYFYYLSAGGNVPETLSGLKGSTVERFEHANFVDVACGRGKHGVQTYALTADGQLCCFEQSRIMTRWVGLDSPKGFAIDCDEHRIYAACANGVVRMLEAGTFKYIATLPTPRARDERDASPDATPNATAVRVLDCRKRVVVRYTDRVLVWRVKDMSKVRRLRSLEFHTDGVWDVAMVPPTGASFVTCSVDQTLRFWSCARGQQEKRLLLAGRGLRSVDVASSGRFVAAGDISGRVHLITVASDGSVERTLSRNAHDAELSSVAFSPSASLLATSSRDRLVHIFRSLEDLGDVQTLENHSGAVTRVRWDSNGAKLVTSGADRSIVVSTVVKRASPSPPTQTSSIRVVRAQSVAVVRGTIYDVDVDAGNMFMVTAGQDKNLNIWNIAGEGKPSNVRSYQIDACAYRIKLDPSGNFIAVCCFDKWVRVLDFYSGECVVQFAGHSELVTSLKWTPDCRRLVTVSGDSCVFIWRLHSSITASMRARLREMGTFRESVVDGLPKLADGELNSTSTMKVISTKQKNEAHPPPLPAPTVSTGLFEKMVTEANVKKATLRREAGSGQGDLKDDDRDDDGEETPIRHTRIGLEDLRRVTGENSTHVTSVQAISGGVKNGSIADGTLLIAGKKAILHENTKAATPPFPTTSRWSDRVRAGGYDLMAAGVREHRYHISKACKSKGLTLSAEMTGIVATSAVGRLEDDVDEKEDKLGSSEEETQSTLVYEKTDVHTPLDPSRFKVTSTRLDTTSDLMTCDPSKLVSSDDEGDESVARRSLVEDKGAIDVNMITTATAATSRGSVSETKNATSDATRVPTPSPPTPSRVSRSAGGDDVNDGNREGERQVIKVSAFRESLSNVQVAVRNALAQLRELSRSGSADDVKEATDRFEKMMQTESIGVQREVGTVRMSRMIARDDPILSGPAPTRSVEMWSSVSSLRASDAPPLPKPSSNLSSSENIEAILERYSDRLVGIISKKLKSDRV